MKTAHTATEPMGKCGICGEVIKPKRKFVTPIEALGYTEFTFCGLAYVPLVQTLKLRTHLIAALRQAAVMCSCGLWNENV